MSHPTSNYTTMLRYRGYQFHVDDTTNQVTVKHLEKPGQPVEFPDLNAARAWIDQRTPYRAPRQF